MEVLSLSKSNKKNILSLLAGIATDEGKLDLHDIHKKTIHAIGHHLLGIDESDDILKKIFEHQSRLDLTCRFTWTENTVAIWDNRSVIHYAIADFYPGRGLGYERIMDRVAIEGDHPQ